MLPVTKQPAQILGFPHYEISTEDAGWLDPDFPALLEGAREISSRPSLIETTGGALPVLVPGNFHHHPLWVIRLPEEFAADAPLLRKSKPSPVNISSIDLLQNKTYLVWPGHSCHLLFEATGVDWSIAKATQTLRLVVIFVTPSRLLLSTFRMDDEFMTQLWACSMCAGSNYSPHNVFSDEELAAAKARALAAPDAWELEPDEEGRAPLRLQVITAKRRP